MVLLRINPQRQEGNREKTTRNPSGKTMVWLCFWSRITASRCIAVKWFLKVYWLLPFSIVDSFAEHRRFFCRAPTTLLLSTMNTWASQSTSFPKGVISCFHRTLFLFINWISRQLDRSHTTSTNTCHKTLLFLLTKRSYRTYWTLVICRAVPRYVLALL